MISWGPTKLLSRPVRLCLLTLCAIAHPAFSQFSSDPKQLQQDGIARIDRWTTHVRQTGDASSTVSDLALAYSELKVSHDLFVQRNNFADAAWSAIKMGDILRYTNRWGEAVPFYQKAIESAKRASRADYQTKALSRLAYSEMKSAEIDAARGHAREAMRVGETCGNKDFYFEALDVAAEIEANSGNLVAAGEYLDKALAMSGEIQDKQQLYLGYSDRGDIYEKIAEKCDYQHDFDVCYQAVELSRTNYQKAIAITQELGFNFFTQLFQGIVNNLEVRKALIQKMQQTYQTTYASAFNPQAPKDVLVTERFTTGAANPATLAMVENAVKELQAWQARMQQQGMIAQDFNPTDFALEGQLAEMRGNEDEALTKYMQSVALLEKDRRKLRDEQARGKFLEDKINDYYRPAMILLERKQYPQAFALFERARSRAMADLIASRSLGLGTPKERELFSQLQTQRASIAAKQEKLFNLVSSESRDQHTKEIMGLENDIAGLQQQYQELETRIAKEAPKLKELTSSEPVTLESVQRAAAAGGYDLFYYVVTETAVILWHINGTEVHVKNVFLPHNELIPKAATLQNSLVAAKTTPDAKFDDSMARQLFLFLIQPALAYIKSNHIIIVPQEELASIPFQSLLDPATGKFLGETYALSYAPSATVLATLDQKQNLKDSRLLAVADPAIADASAEVEAIGKLYPGRSKVVSKDPLSKTDVEALVSDYNAVHLSVHGKFNASDPLLSYLEFKPAPPADGHLTAAEMFGLSLQKSSLVVLSACETGKVQETHASEALGMVRSLLYAGASTLVLSSWEVNAASTKLWMETFYREGQSKSPAEAARLAVVAVRSHPEYSHPFYWAPFVMTGK